MLGVVLVPTGFERGFEELLPDATRERVGERLHIHVASVDPASYIALDRVAARHAAT